MSTSEKKLDKAHADGARFAVNRLSYLLVSGSPLETIDDVVAYHNKAVDTADRLGRVQGIVEAFRLLGIKDSVISLVRCASNIDEVSRILAAYNMGKAEDAGPAMAGSPPIGSSPVLVHGVIMTPAECTLAKSNKIAAIKEIRNRTRLGLKGALEVVNDYQRYLAQAQSEAA